MSKWFLLFEKKPLSASENMARDEYLFNLCHEKKIGFLRLYSWEKPSFSFGVSQKIFKAVNVDFLNKKNYSYVRRITGGKTVLHDDEITYAVVSSEDIFYKNNDLYKSYMLISKVLVDAFRFIGVDACLSKGSPSVISKTNYPCFSFPTPNEVEVHGKKIVGSSQKRNNNALLQHGSIPISMDYQLYADGANSKVSFIRRSMTTLSNVSNKTGDCLVHSLIDRFQTFIDDTLEEFDFDQKDNYAITEIEKKYNSHEWNCIL